jgi:ABC-type proline/glycine betaine transport system permease subunit
LDIVLVGTVTIALLAMAADALLAGVQRTSAAYVRG